MIKALLTLMFFPLIIVWKVIIGILKFIGLIDIFGGRD